MAFLFQDSCGCWYPVPLHRLSRWIRPRLLLPIRPSARLLRQIHVSFQCFNKHLYYFTNPFFQLQLEPLATKCKSHNFFKS